MNYKLQNFSTENDGQNSVGRDNNSTSQAEIASHDAGSASSGQAELPAGRETVLGLRCEVARSNGYDPTGENAVACGAPAQLLCEYCGPMCSSCAEETFCFYGEHKLSSLEEQEPARQRSRRTRRVNEVVYVEIKCPNCRRVRLALPKKHRPKARRKCPVCKREAPAEYLAHGFTRRRLPYHEVFEIPPDRNELTILPGGKRRVPWDVRDLADYRKE